mmetsp:Transcript_20520/g.47818  ORF Transcript_20520/g.47818 Transcript_20520/m.47818 type:complete len:262 (-) Transcript_20520:1085-1870(-)
MVSDFNVKSMPSWILAQSGKDAVRTCDKCSFKTSCISCATWSGNFMISTRVSSDIDAPLCSNRRRAGMFLDRTASRRGMRVDGRLASSRVGAPPRSSSSALPSDAAGTIGSMLASEDSTAAPPGLLRACSSCRTSSRPLTCETAATGLLRGVPTICGSQDFLSGFFCACFAQTFSSIASSALALELSMPSLPSFSPRSCAEFITASSSTERFLLWCLMDAVEKLRVLSPRLLSMLSLMASLSSSPSPLSCHVHSAPQTHRM